MAWTIVTIEHEETKSRNIVLASITRVFLTYKRTLGGAILDQKVKRSALNDFLLFHIL